MSVPAWLVPSLRATRWSVLAGASAGAVAVLGFVRMATSRAPDPPWAAITFAVVVAAAVLAFADPAGEFVRVVPTSPLRRAVRRAAVVSGPAAVGLAAVVAAERLAYPGGWPVPGAPSLAALAMCGVAVLTRWSGRGAAAEVAAAVVLGWVTLGALATELGVPARWAMPWSQWPAPVLAGSLMVTVTTLRRQ